MGIVTEVRGHCPSCGQCTLGLDAKHEIVCENPTCNRPSAAHEILDDGEPYHIVKIDHNGFSVKHPLIERLDEQLLRCSLGEKVAEQGKDWLVDGDLEKGQLTPGKSYRMWWAATPDDAWVEWPVDDFGYAVPE